MTKIIEQYRKEMEDQGVEPRSRDSQKWFEEKLKDLTRPINRRQLQSETMGLRGIMTPHVGRMYLFFYMPEGVLTLPYYDMFPVVILMKMEKEYFQGLNLHYLPLDLKQEFFEKILTRASKSTFDKQTFLRIDYDYLNQFRKFRAFRPCFKQYRLKNVRGRIINVPSSEWEIVMNLPVALWRKRSEDIVHIDSRKMYRNT